jgi:hypothetical protein
MTMAKAKVVRRVAALGAIALYIALGAWAAACLDLTPVTAGEVVTIPIPIPDVQPPPIQDASTHRDAPAGGDAALVDGAPVDGAPVDGGHDVYVPPPCLACITAPDMPGPGCATEIAACMADTECEAVYLCVIATDCLLLPTRQDLLACATPCVTEAGITSECSKAGMLVDKAATCITDPPPGCGHVCAPTD